MFGAYVDRDVAVEQGCSGRAVLPLFQTSELSLFHSEIHCFWSTHKVSAATGNDYERIRVLASGYNTGVLFAVQICVLD